MTQFSDIDKRRIQFQTRRGLLELDIILKRFMEQHFHQLSNQELEIFVAILDLQDQELLSIINQLDQPPQQDFIPLLEKIRNCH